MKIWLEEYGFTVTAILAGGLTLLCLIKGIEPGGFLEALGRRFSAMTLG